MHEGHQREEDRGYGCEWFVVVSFPYLEQSHCRSSLVDRSVTMKSVCWSRVEPNRCAVGISSISGDGHGRGASRFFSYNMHGYHHWRKGGVGRVGRIRHGQESSWR